MVMVFILSESGLAELFPDDEILESVYFDIKQLFEGDGYPIKGRVLLQNKFDVKSILSSLVITPENLHNVKSKIKELDKESLAFVDSADSGGAFIIESRQYLDEIREEYADAVMSGDEGKITEFEGLINTVERKIDRHKIKIEGGKKKLILIQKQLICLWQMADHIHHDVNKKNYSESKESYEQSLKQFAEIFAGHWKKREACGYIGLRGRTEARKKLFANVLEVIAQKVK
jgi:hypothetical protein